MSGHSKWAQIKHKKAGADAKRGALFSKLGRIITVAAREGGGDPAMNPRLRQAIEQARDSGMPKDNIERAILRGAGGAEGADLRPVEYEAYGPGGSAFLITGLTDNSNRTTSEIKHILDKAGGRLAASGSVLWMFERRALVEFALPAKPGEAELALIDAGAEDIITGVDRIEAVVPPEALEAFRERASSAGFAPVRSSIAAIPANPITPDAETRIKAEALATALEEHQDINEVWTNIAEAQ